MSECAFCEGYKRFIKEAKEQNREPYMIINALFCYEEESMMFRINYCPLCGRKLNGEKV